MNKSTAAFLLAGPVTNDSRVLKTISSFVALGWDCDLFCICNEQEDLDLFPKGVRIFPLSKNITIFERISGRLWLTRAKTNKFMEAANTAGIKYKMVWSNDLPCLYPGFLLASKADSIFVYDSHEIYLETINQFFPSNSGTFKSLFHRLNIWIMRFLGRIDERRFGQKADLVITVNNSLRHYFLAKYSWKNIAVLRNVPILNEITPVNLKKLYGISENSKIVLYQGALNSGRALDQLIEAFQYLANEYFLLIFGKGYIKLQLEELVSKLGLQNRVLFAGLVAQKDLLNYTAGANCGVNLLDGLNLSKYYASPNKLFEYVHAGIPVLCSLAPESNLFLQKYKVGRSCELNPHAIAVNLRKLVEEDSYEKAEFERCRYECNWDAEFEKISAAINNLTPLRMVLKK